MPRLTHFLVPTVLLVLGATSAYAKLAAQGGSVEFTAVGPGGLKIAGKSTDVSASDDGANVVITVPLAKLDTGIGLRNSHMRDKYLETGKYPNAVLTVPKAQLALANGGSGDATGTLALHGKQKLVKVHYTAKKEGADFVVTGTTRVDMTEFGIEQPSFAGATVKPAVDVAVAFRAKDQ